MAGDAKMQRKPPIVQRAPDEDAGRLAARTVAGAIVRDNGGLGGALLVDTWCRPRA
jgi:hypothetical protein